MALDPFLLTLLLSIVALSFVVFLFVPSFTEILRPKDRKPRKILKAPLRKMMRHELKSVINEKSDLVSDSIASKNLEGFLKEKNVKFHTIGNSTVRILGNIAFPPNFQVWDNIVVEGSLTAGDYCIFHGSVKAKGDIIIGNWVVLNGNLISKGNIDVKDEVVISGLIHSEGSVRLGENVFIGLSVVADGDVEIHENSEVKKNILTYGIIRVLKYPRLDLPSALDDIG